MRASPVKSRALDPVWKRPFPNEPVFRPAEKRNQLEDVDYLLAYIERQEGQLQAQSEFIQSILNELALHRALTEEEAAYAK